MKKQFPKLKNKAILSPMAGVTDVAFRALCKKYGAALTCTEFLNSTAINRKNKRTLEMLKKDKSEKPSQIQLFGSNEDEVVKAAQLVSKKFDIIDINCGCPAWKVIKTGAGSELLKNPKQIASLIKKLNNSVKNPITIKIRKGINDKTTNAIEVARLAEKSGASALAIHGRTQKQGYSGKADWEIIKKVKQSIKIPVIGNGDVFTPEDFKEKLDFSEVDYILIARGAMTNPYIFKQINDYMKTGKYKHKNKIDQFFEYLTLTKKHKTEFQIIKRHAINFTKGMKGSARLRDKLVKIKDLKELSKEMKDFKQNEI
ncbi:tRNA dihydrouridine synthase DusB [Candidatus Pacearchaeota archaeon]|nr:tRNA dihydrouridine synthase DusB [Candidatus Pacearchaeota archaeon]|tara:strand:- start:48 stop:989 length:942 start_codon:yes stop_codon:yes gene_type:complete